VAAEALEQSVLESKDKDQLLAIAKALGLRANARTKKADIIDQILETTGSPAAPVAVATVPPAVTVDDPLPPTELPLDAAPVDAPAPTGNGQSAVPAPAVESPVDNGDGDEPLAEWERELAAGGDAGDNGAGDGGATEATGATARTSGSSPSTQTRPTEGEAKPSGGGQQSTASSDAEGESRNRRRRRRRKGRGTDGPQGDDVAVADVRDGEAPVSNEPVPVAGYLDMRDEGYGFLRVKGYLPSREDSYLPVKLARQYGLRKGDHVTGLSRPAGRNEKNPAMLEIHSVNGGDPEAARRRPRFEDLTALFPDEKLRLEDPSDPSNMTARIIDLVSPIGKGQRGIIVSPPKAGKTTIMKTIAHSIETNNPEVKLIVLLIDERPEEVTDMRRHVQGEVISSTFDRPSDEHTHVAELAIEKAKRLVEQGQDVVVMLDGITRLSRAYNLAAPASGRILSGGIDAGALYPPKKFFGAARNVEEGGSLTILATALVETNSRMDEAIFEEFKGTGNMELRLDRKLAERRIYPAIDVDASSTRHEELLFDRKQLQMVWKLRRVLSGLAADGNAAPGLELLMDRLKTFRSNDQFLDEIAKQPSM
jgi:transcription termination factor Rho